MFKLPTQARNCECRTTVVLEYADSGQVRVRTKPVIVLRMVNVSDVNLWTVEGGDSLWVTRRCKYKLSWRQDHSPLYNVRTCKQKSREVIECLLYRK